VGPAIGVNIDDLLVSQPDTGEQALEICELLVRSNAVDVIVVDSVAALIPRAEIEGEMGDTHVGLQARLMSQAMRKLTGVIARSNCTVIFINQIREKIGVMFGSPETTPGGRALKFYSSVRIDIRRTGSIKDGDEKRRQPRPRQGRQEQGRPALPPGRVRHHVQRGHQRHAAT
jgi:recombination protein RecA